MDMKESCVRRYVWLSLVVALAGCADSRPSAAQAAGQSAASGQDQILATVNGVAISEGDVRRALGSELARAEAQVYDLKRQQLDELIATHLLEAEAKRRGVTRDALEAEEITAKVAPLTEQ